MNIGQNRLDFIFRHLIVKLKRKCMIILEARTPFFLTSDNNCILVPVFVRCGIVNFGCKKTESMLSVILNQLSLHLRLKINNFIFNIVEDPTKTLLKSISALTSDFWCSE